MANDFFEGRPTGGESQVNTPKDASGQEWAAPSPLHIQRRKADFPEIPRSTRETVSAPGDFVFPCQPPRPARSWQTAAGTFRFQLFFQAAPYRAFCRRGFLRTE